MQATHYDFNNYLPVFQNTLTFKAPASFENATFASKIATIVNQTPSEKASAQLLAGAAGSSNRLRNQSFYTSHL